MLPSEPDLDASGTARVLLGMAMGAPPFSEPPPGLLECLACGWATREEALLAQQFLARHPRLRSEFLQMRGVFAEACRRPLSKSRSDTPLLPTMQAALRATLEVSARWSDSCRRLISGGPLPDAVSRTIAAAASRFDFALPSDRPAFSRGRARLCKAVLPGGNMADIRVQSHKGFETVHARLAHAYPSQRELTVLARTPAGSWAPLSWGAPRAEDFEVQIPTERLEQLGISAGSLAPEKIELAESGYLPAPTLLIQLVPQPRGLADSHVLHLDSPPQVARGTLTIEFQWPRDLMQGMGRDPDLDLLLWVGGGRLSIGQWKLSVVLQNGRVALCADVHGADDCSLELTSLFQLEVRRT